LILICSGCHWKINQKLI